jgi:hypothetical protein
MQTCKYLEGTSIGRASTWCGWLMRGLLLGRRIRWSVNTPTFNLRLIPRGCDGENITRWVQRDALQVETIVVSPTTSNCSSKAFFGMATKKRDPDVTVSKGRFVVRAGHLVQIWPH